MDSEQPAWRSFFAKIVLRRVSPEQFRTLVQSFQYKYDRPSSQDLINILFSESRKGAILDLRLPLYTRELFHLGLCDVSDVLDYMLPHAKDEDAKEDVRIYDHAMLEMETIPPSLEATIFQMIITEVNQGLLKIGAQIRAILLSLTAWVLLFPSSSVLGYLISATLNSPLAQELFSESSNKSIHPSLSFVRKLTRARV